MCRLLLYLSIAFSCVLEKLWFAGIISAISSYFLNPRSNFHSITHCRKNVYNKLPSFSLFLMRATDKRGQLRAGGWRIKCNFAITSKKNIFVTSMWGALTTLTVFVSLPLSTVLLISYVNLCAFHCPCQTRLGKRNTRRTRPAALCG